LKPAGCFLNPSAGSIVLPEGCWRIEGYGGIIRCCPEYSCHPDWDWEVWGEVCIPGLGT
jgi:hypothetical protein